MTARTECPTDCGRFVDDGKLLCATCWRRVPSRVQRAVYVAWAALRAGDPGSADEYRAARDEAVKHARGDQGS